MTTDSNVEKTVAKMLDATSDPSSVVPSPNSFKMANDLRMKELVGHIGNSTLPKAQPDVQEVQLGETLDANPSQRSANSACIGSSSSDLMDRKVGISNKSIFRYSFENLVEGEDGIWSILTDKLYYLQLTNSEPIQFQEANLSKSAKKLLFDAANNNIPAKQYYKLLDKEKQQLQIVNGVNNNICKFDDQYDKLNVTLDKTI